MAQKGTKWRGVNLVNIGSQKDHCYGLSIKWWLKNEIKFIPTIYQQDGYNRKADVRFNRLVIGWLKATFVFYWPSKETSNGV